MDLNLAYISHVLLKQGFQEQIIGSAREILDMVDKVKVAAKSEPENLGHRVSLMEILDMVDKVKVANKSEPENLGHRVKEILNMVDKVKVKV